MAYIKPRKTSQGITYHLCDLVNGQEVCKKLPARSKSEANQWLYKHLGEKADGKPNSLLRNEISFGDFVEKTYLEVSKHTKTESSYHRDLSHMKALLEEWKYCLLSKIDMNSIQLAQIKWAKSGLSKKTINNRAILLSAVLRMAFKKDLIIRMPEIPKLKIDKKPPRYYSENELKNILGNVRPFVRDFCKVLLHTGLRSGELRRLMWKDIDLKAKQLMVLESKSHSFRPIPINDELREHLIYLKGIAREGQVYLFEGINGGIFNDFYKAYERELKRLGLNGTLHMWRHTFASRLAQKGVSPFVIQRLLGHASITTTQIYSHLRIDDLEEAVQKLGTHGTVTEPSEILDFRIA